MLGFVGETPSPKDVVAESSTGKRRRTVHLTFGSQPAQHRSDSSDEQETGGMTSFCTPQQAAKFGELVATEVGARAVEPFVAR